MRNHYKKGFFDLASELTTIKANPAESSKECLEIQNKIISKMRRVEKRIRGLKSNSNQSEELLETIAEYQLIHRILRSFGDGIAHIYIDRWDIKPIARGNSPGFISGKKGFALEYQMMKQSCNKGLPSLLADLTNCLRHGDVFCFKQGAPFPLVIEMKTNKKSGGSRASRQNKRNRKTFDYLNSGVGEYQGHLLTRKSIPREIVDYSKIINKLADAAVLHGFDSEYVGRGLWYLAHTSGDVHEQFESALSKFEKPTYLFVTADMYTNQVDSYYPITMVLNNPNTLATYLAGKLDILVLIDVNEIEKTRKGSIENITYNPEGEWALSIDMTGVPTTMGVSRNMFNRLFVEFMDIDWFVENISETRSTIDGYMAGELE